MARDFSSQWEAAMKNRSQAHRDALTLARACIIAAAFVLSFMIVAGYFPIR
jgi:hypothetical protein